MGNLEYIPEDISKTEFINKYIKDKNTNHDEILKQMDETAAWMKFKLINEEKIYESGDKNKYNIMMDDILIYKLTLLLGNKPEKYLQRDFSYLRIQKDFRHLYGLRPFNWSD